MPRYLDELIRRLGASVPVVPAPNRWWIHPDKNPGPQAIIEKALERNAVSRNSMTSGAFLDPRTGEIIDGQAFASGGVAIDPSTGRPSMGVSGLLGPDAWDGVPAAIGPIVNTNLVRRSVGWQPVGEAVDVPFLATAESGPQHFYGLGIDFESPVLLRNTGGTQNPTLRPRSRGSVWGNEQIGEMVLKGKQHPVYDVLRVAPRGHESSGTLLRYGVLAPLLGASEQD